jgi:hypothetical protein
MSGDARPLRPRETCRFYGAKRRRECSPVDASRRAGTASERSSAEATVIGMRLRPVPMWMDGTATGRRTISGTPSSVRGGCRDCSTSFLSGTCSRRGILGEVLLRLCARRTLRRPAQLPRPLRRREITDGPSGGPDDRTRQRLLPGRPLRLPWRRTPRPARPSRGPRGTLVDLSRE